MTEKKIKISKLLPVFMVYIVMGFPDIIGVATAHVKEDFGLSSSVAQILPFMALIWFFFLSVPTGILQDKYGKKKLVLIGAFLIGVGMIIPLIIYTYYTILFGIVMLGIGNTIVQVSSNPLMYDVVPNDKFSSYMSLSQFVKAISAILGPVIAGAGIAWFGDWKLVFIVYGISSLLSMAWLYFTPIEESKIKEEPATFKSCFSLLRNKFILLMAMGIFFVVGADIGMNTNISTYLKESFALDLKTADLGISLYFTALMIGRFLGAILLNYFSSSKFLITTTLVAISGLLIMIFTHDLLTARIAIFVVGLSSANLFPLIFSIALQKIPNRANEISGLMIMAISGGAFIPPVMGMISTGSGIRAGFYVLILSMFYILLAAFYALKKESLINNKE